MASIAWKMAAGAMLLVGMCVAPIREVSASQNVNRSLKSSKPTDCGKNSNLRDAVCRGWWSGKTIALFNPWMASNTTPERRFDLSSPDGKKVIRVRGSRVRLLINGKHCWTPFGNMNDAEVGWVPDSTRLFVTWTETGDLGPWHLQAYDVTNDGLKEIRGLTTEARKDMLQREHKAPIPKWVARQYREMWKTLDDCEPDIAGSQWLNGSNEILFAAMAGPDSGCRYMGDFVVYRVSVPSGRILQTYSTTEAHRLFGDDDLPRIQDDGEDL